MSIAADSPDILNIAGTLIEALPYMRRYQGAVMVIKYGGHAMGDEKVARDFARDVVLLKQVGISPVVGHGGGPQIKAMLDRLKHEHDRVHPDEPFQRPGYPKLAKLLTEAGYPTPKGHGHWWPAQVQQLLDGKFERYYSARPPAAL